VKILGNTKKLISYLQECGFGAEKITSFSSDGLSSWEVKDGQKRAASIERRRVFQYRPDMEIYVDDPRLRKCEKFASVRYAIKSVQEV